ncbi:MAG TPA: Na+/H+ antiporter [Solirubrobacterales bacterium]|jgi:CPA1 family monovalent cation:H+ antiporter|nr:Na+/H+ antiporter [Solirubrobacterales bacterium]
MDIELALTTILAVVVLLLLAAQFTRVPYPILLVLGGLGLAVLTPIPDVELNPDLVLIVILPPLLYAAAYFTPLRELRRNVREISALAIGLVLATMIGVALVAHEALGFDWAPSFVLGAIVSPTDPVAATAIARRLGIPGRIVSIVEGESLINDGTALVAFKFAVAAVVSGSFNLFEATGEFVVVVTGGVAVGIAVGALIAFVRRRIYAPPVEVTLALFSGYFAYLPAEAIGVSGVLAAVTVGIYMGRLTSVLTTPTTRIQGEAVWEIVQFLLNSALFVLVGLQLPGILDAINGNQTGELLLDGALIAATVMVIRLLWVFPFTYVPRLLIPQSKRNPRPPWRQTLIVAWTGMRGAVSLAAALALPLVVDGGGMFPERNLIIFLTFSVILGTLLLQGFTLPPLIQALGLDDVDEVLELEELSARQRAAEAALSRLEELTGEDWVMDDTAERVRGAYVYRHRRFSARIDDGDGQSAIYEQRSESFQRLTRELLEAQRSVLIRMRDDGEINDDVLRTLERELDLEDSRLEI